MPFPDYAPDVRGAGIPDFNDADRSGDAHVGDVRKRAGQAPA